MTDAVSPLASVEEILDYRFADPALLRRALTHTSLRRSKTDPAYERLEFLGDRVLGLAIAELLLEQFPDASEGELGQRLAVLASGRTLARVARSIALGPHIRMSEDGRNTGTDARPSVLADCCEAVIGAMYLDGGLEAARDFVRRHWSPLVDEVETRVAKTALQEWLQARGLPLPAYSVVDRAGPAHDPVFTVELSVSGREPVRASGSSKRSAELRAAAQMLAALESPP